MTCKKLLIPFLIILILSSCCKAQKDSGWIVNRTTDTLAVIMLYSDLQPQEYIGYKDGKSVSFMDIDYSTKWMYGFMVDEWLKKVQYFDENKKPLRNTIKVWISTKKP